MPTLKKIEDRTNWFIESYKRLEEQRRLPSNVELAAIMGMPSKSTVSNILRRQQNIQPDQWQKFKDHFGIEDLAAGSENIEREPTMMEVLAGLTEGFRAIASTMKSIENKMAREQTLADLEANYLKRTLAASLTVAQDHEHVMKEMKNLAGLIQAQKTEPSKGSGKGRDRTDGGLQKTGKTPA